MAVKSGNWKNYLIELAVIFIGISLAFLSENLREGFQESRLEKKLLKNLFEELDSDRAGLEENIAQNSAKLSRADNLIEMLLEEEVDMDSLYLVIFDLAEANHFNPQSVTYNSLVNSGNFDLISDFSLKEKIIEYYLFLENKKIQDNIYNEFLKDYMMPFILSDMDLLNRKLLDEKVYRELGFRNMIVSYRTLLNQDLINARFIHSLNAELITSYDKTLKNPED